MSSIEEKVEKLIGNSISELGYELYDIEYAKEGKNYFLRIFIDKPNGIDINDCEKVNNVVEEILDKEDPIKEQYFLEISSPGVERVLRKDKHLQDNVGENIEISLFKSINGDKKIDGILEKFDDSYITILYKNSDLKIERKNISLIKIKYDWN